MVVSEGFVTSNMIIPFLRLEAPSRVITAILPSLDTFTSLTVRASTFTVSMVCILRGSVTSQRNASPRAPQVPVIA